MTQGDKGDRTFRVVATPDRDQPVGAVSTGGRGVHITSVIVDPEGDRCHVGRATQPSRAASSSARMPGRCFDVAGRSAWCARSAQRLVGPVGYLDERLGDLGDRRAVLMRVGGELGEVEAVQRRGVAAE